MPETIETDRARALLVTTKARAILVKATAAHRGLTADETKEFETLTGEADRLTQRSLEAASHESAGTVAGGVFLGEGGEGTEYATSGAEFATSGARQVGARGRRDYRSLFGPHVSADGWKDSREWLRAACSGRFHPELRTVSEGNDSAGGFLIPTEFSAEIHDVALEDEIILRRARVEPMRSDTKRISAVEIGSHASHLYGGVVAYWTSEGGAMTEASPKFRAMQLVAKKVTILLLFSSEWAEDAADGQNGLARLAGGALGWYRDRAFLTGSGAGQPLGILNGPCLITVAAETGQAAASVCYENLAKMLAALHPSCWKNSVWIVHPGLIPSLLTLGVTIGTGGAFYPTLREDSGQFSMLSRPVIFSEKMTTPGTVGDIMLCDFSQYVVGMRRDLRFEVSTGPHFSTDQIDARLICRVDGQPLWNETLTLADGTTKLGPFIALAARVEIAASFLPQAGAGGSPAPAAKINAGGAPTAAAVRVLRPDRGAPA